MILYIQEGDSQTAVHGNTQQLCLWEQLHILMSKQECVQRRNNNKHYWWGVTTNNPSEHRFNATNHNNVNR